MKKIIIVTGMTLAMLSMAYAEGMRCGAGKCGGSMQMDKSTVTLHKMHRVSGYDVGVSAEKPLFVGNNIIKVALFKEGKKVDAKVKVKFFMPEMPGMPYMESKDKGETKDGSFDAKINFSMGGTWQYQLKFKTADDVVHKVNGSVNL